jgi:hypothetical protein
MWGGTTGVTQQQSGEYHGFKVGDRRFHSSIV